MQYGKQLFITGRNSKECSGLGCGIVWHRVSFKVEFKFAYLWYRIEFPPLNSFRTCMYCYQRSEYIRLNSKRIVSAETIWGNTVVRYKVYFHIRHKDFQLMLQFIKMPKNLIILKWLNFLAFWYISSVNDRTFIIEFEFNSILTLVALL